MFNTRVGSWILDPTRLMEVSTAFARRSFDIHEMCNPKKHKKWPSFALTDVTVPRTPLGCDTDDGRGEEASLARFSCTSGGMLEQIGSLS